MDILNTYRWLASDEGAIALAQIQRWREEGSEVTTIAKRLRKQWQPEQARLALEMHDLRRRSLKKFALGEQLWFTRVGLEQSTSERIARYKASRFPDACCHDLCCGIGGDLMSLAQGRPSTGWECDEVTAWVARQNVRVSRASTDGEEDALQSQVQQQAVPSPEALQGAVWHLDPDRRPNDRRTTTLEQFSPDVEYINQLIRCAPNGALKVAPASSVPDSWREACSREWIGEGRECKQQVLWFGDLSPSIGQVAATVLAGPADGLNGETVTDSESAPVEVRHGVDPFLYEPHATVLAAGLRDALANRFELRPLAAGHVLLTGSQRAHSLLFSTFEIIDETELNRKSIERMLDRHDVGEVELKPHGLEPNDKWRRFSVARRPGLRSTLWLLRIGTTYSAILSRRLRL